MPRRTCAALLGLLILSPAAVPAEKEEPAARKPLGTWTRAVKDTTLTVTFKADTFTFKVEEGGSTITAHASYGVTRDGTVFGIITDVEKTGSGPDKGDLFSFRAKPAKGTLTISDLNGTNVSDEARATVQGEYKRKGK
jgi:hypothetical protein